MSSSGTPPPGSGWQPPTPPGGYGTQTGYDQPAPGSLGTPGNATASLVLGIIGIVLCPLICSIPAIVLGNSALSQIRADARYAGDGTAKAGIILGWIGVAWAVLIIVMFIFFAAVARESVESLATLGTF